MSHSLVFCLIPKLKNGLLNESKLMHYFSIQKPELTAEETPESLLRGEKTQRLLFTADVPVGFPKGSIEK